MSEEKVLKVSTARVLVGAIESTMCVGVQCKEEPRRVLPDIEEEFLQRVGSDWESDVQVDARDDDILGAAVEDNDSTVPVT